MYDQSFVCCPDIGQNVWSEVEKSSNTSDLDLFPIFNKSTKKLSFAEVSNLYFQVLNLCMQYFTFLA